MDSVFETVQFIHIRLFGKFSFMDVLNFGLRLKMKTMHRTMVGFFCIIENIDNVNSFVIFKLFRSILRWLHLWIDIKGGASSKSIQSVQEF